MNVFETQQAPPVTVGANTTLSVTYRVNFTAHERRLAALLMPIRETFTVQGMDGNTATTLATFQRFISPPGVADAATTNAVTVDVSSERAVLRSTLQEDPTAGDNDEIRVRIDIAMGQFPLTDGDNSNIRVVAG